MDSNVSSGPAYEHIAWFLERRWTQTSIEMTSGVHRQIVSKIVAAGEKGTTVPIREANVEALLRLTEKDLLEKSRVVPTSLISWRVEGLHGNGWTYKDLAKKVGYQTNFVSEIAKEIIKSVEPDVHEDFVCLFEMLRYAPGPGLRAAEEDLHKPHEYNPDGYLWRDLAEKRHPRAPRAIRREFEAVERLNIIDMVLHRVPFETIVTLMGVEIPRIVDVIYQAKLPTRKDIVVTPAVQQAHDRVKFIMGQWYDAPQADPCSFAIQLGMPAPQGAAVSGREAA